MLEAGQAVYNVYLFILGSDKWTKPERKLFKDALSIYSKDFLFVQKMVRKPLFSASFNLLFSC